RVLSVGAARVCRPADPDAGSGRRPRRAGCAPAARRNPAPPPRRRAGVFPQSAGQPRRARRGPRTRGGAAARRDYRRTLLREETRMTAARPILPAGAVLATVLAGCGSGGPKVALRYHPPTGAVYHYAFEQHSKIKFE